MKKYNAVFRLNDKSLTIVGIPHAPQLGVAQSIPGQAACYGLCVRVERDDTIACLRQHPEGQLIEFAGY